MLNAAKSATPNKILRRVGMTVSLLVYGLL